MDLNKHSDGKGNLHIGSFGRASEARITVDFAGSNAAGIALDVAADSTKGAVAGIKLGDFYIGQDTAANGTKDFGIKDANGVVIMSMGTGAAAGQTPDPHPKKTLFSTNIPLIVLPDGNVTAGGVNTSGTANPLIYLKTYCWYPANALATSIAAGWYYTVWTTTTACTSYLNTWDGASEPTVPAVLVPVTDGKGAFTGMTAAAALIKFPFAAATPNSVYKITAKYKQTNNGNAKTVVAKMTDGSGTTFWTDTLTSLLDVDSEYIIKLNGVADKQTAWGKLFNATAYVKLAATLFAETMSAAWVLAFVPAKATSTDVLVIEHIRVEQTF